MADRYYGKNWDQKRQATLARDDGRCQSCGRADDLEVHHVIPLREFDDPEDANFLDNLVALCPRCHTEWEGKRERPKLAEVEPGTTINEIVDQLIFETVFRHSLSGALAEMYYRWLAGDPHRCSKCLSKYTDSPENYIAYFTRYIQSVVVAGISSPTQSPFDERDGVQERYCQRCEQMDYHENDLRAHRARHAARAFFEAGYPVDGDELREAFTRPSHIDRDDGHFDGKTARFAAAVADVRQLPEPPNVDVSRLGALPNHTSAAGQNRSQNKQNEWLEWYESTEWRDANSAE